MIGAPGSEPEPVRCIRSVALTPQRRGWEGNWRIFAENALEPGRGQEYGWNYALNNYGEHRGEDLLQQEEGHGCNGGAPSCEA